MVIFSFFSNQPRRIFFKAGKSHVVRKRPNSVSSQWGIRGENGNCPFSVCERKCVIRKCFAQICHYNYHSPLSTIPVLAYFSDLPISPQVSENSFMGFWSYPFSSFFPTSISMFSLDNSYTLIVELT